MTARTQLIDDNDKVLQLVMKPIDGSSQHLSSTATGSTSVAFPVQSIIRLSVEGEGYIKFVPSPAFALGSTATISDTYVSSNHGVEHFKIEGSNTILAFSGSSVKSGTAHVDIME